MLLKIGNRYIETDLISEWNVLEADGKNVLTLYAVMGASTARFTKDAEIDALLRWLEANSTDIMATEPAPAETPRNDNAIPKTMRAFVIGQTVRVRDDVDGEASGYTGRTGQVTHLDRSRASGVVRYFTTLSTHDAFYADELEFAD